MQLLNSTASITSVKERNGQRDEICCYSVRNRIANTEREKARCGERALRPSKKADFVKGVKISLNWDIICVTLMGRADTGHLIFPTAWKLLAVSAKKDRRYKDSDVIEPGVINTFDCISIFLTTITTGWFPCNTAAYYLYAHYFWYTLLW